MKVKPDLHVEKSHSRQKKHIEAAVKVIVLQIFSPFAKTNFLPDVF